MFKCWCYHLVYHSLWHFDHLLFAHCSLLALWYWAQYLWYVHVYHLVGCHCLFMCVFSMCIMECGHWKPYKNCSTCLHFQPKQPWEKVIHHNIPGKPWEVVGADIFTLNNKNCVSSLLSLLLLLCTSSVESVSYCLNILSTGSSVCWVHWSLRYCRTVMGIV